MVNWRGNLARRTVVARLCGILSREFWRGHLAVVGYAAFGLILFIVFVVANFPYAQTLSSILAPLGLKLSYVDQRLSLPLGAELRGVRLVSTDGATYATLAEGTDVALAPTLGSLLVGAPGIRIYVELYGGDVRAAIYRSGHAIGLSFIANGLKLDRYPKLSELGTRLEGRLSGAGSAVLSGANLFENQGQVKLAATSLVVKVAAGFPPVRLGELNGTLELNRGILNIKQVDSHGTDLAMTADGSIHLMPNLPGSQLDIRLRIEPTASGRAHLRFLLGLLPRPPDSTPYTLHGPILAPSIS